MLFPRILAVFLLPGLLAAPGAVPASSAGGPAPPGEHSHAHEGVPEKIPEHPAAGDEAPEFSLRDLDGRWTGLGEFLGRGHVVIFFGSLSSSTFKKNAPLMDSLAKDWERLEVKVVLVYTREAHPAVLGKKAPEDYEGRVALARQARKDLKLGIPILVDEWDDKVHAAYGAMPDAAFLLGPRGTILVRQVQANALSLDKELRRLLKVPPPDPGRDGLTGPGRPPA